MKRENVKRAVFQRLEVESRRNKSSMPMRAALLTSVSEKPDAIPALIVMANCTDMPVQPEKRRQQAEVLQLRANKNER